MLTSFEVSLLLFVVWIVFYFINRKKIYSAKIYFFILFMMSFAGIVLDLDSSIYYYTQTYSVYTILLFSVLMLLSLIPWRQYDRWMLGKTIIVNERCLLVIKLILYILVFSSILSIIYCFPFALYAMRLGAYEVRTSEIGLLPPNVLTTIASAIAGLAPFGLLFFFILRLNEKLRKYSFSILLLPIAGIVHSMACTARELYIYLPITFVILYLFFRSSLQSYDKKLIKRLGLFSFTLLFVLFILISISRFGNLGSNSLISGTWGYVYQQPYVFDQTLRFFNNFYAFDRRLPFIGSWFGIGDGRFELYDHVEWSFGTMYSEFFQMFGYVSLFWGSILYLLFFYFMSLIVIRRNNIFAIVVNFTLFIWFTISGIFYFRYGNTSYFLMYLFISIVSLYFPKILLIKRIKDT